MKIILLTLLGYFLIIEGSAEDDTSYDFELFKREIDEKCLIDYWENLGTGNVRITGQTLESFISMVEKVEKKEKDWDIYEVSRALLKRFAFEGVIFHKIDNKYERVQTPDAKNRWTIISKLVGNGPEKFDEDTLTDNEKCSMFFMMGHHVNDTYREGDEKAADSSNVPQDGSSAAAGEQRSNAMKAKKPREQGVISVSGRRDSAVSISKVLNAILASKMDVQQDIKNLLSKKSKFPDGYQISSLIGVTLGDVLSLAVATKSDGNQFGPGGTWNSTVCPTEFQLEGNPSGSTRALLRGALDGLLIGRYLQSKSDVPRSMTLSRVLRMYYSKQGLPSDSDAVTYCKRRDLLGVESRDKIEESARAFYLGRLYEQYDKLLDDPRDTVSVAYQQIGDAVNSDSDPECSPSKVVSEDHPRCETPSNVFAVLDGSEWKTGGYRQQEEVISRLSKSLDFGVGVGSLSTFLNNKEGETLWELKYNGTNPTCASCAMEQPNSDRRQFPGPANTEVIVLDALNKTLQKFEEVTDQLPGVPNKVAVVFQLGDLKETNIKSLEAAANLLRKGHRDARVIMVGRNSEDLKKMATDFEHFEIESNAERLAENLHEKICKVPAIFQFHRCFDHKKTSRNESGNEYVGYVTPNHVQFWSFHPEYFLKSFDVKITFTALHGDIRVCEARGVHNPGFEVGRFKKELCKTTENNGKTMTFHYKDPCHKFHVHNCPSINYAVVGIVPKINSVSNDQCPMEDDKCRRFDQVKFKTSHDGIFCSGCGLLKSSPLFLLLALVSKKFLQI